jgi:DNA-binding response OmpR family regulator
MTKNNSAAKSNPISKKKILVVDDDPDILDAIKLTLEFNGYSVHIYENGDNLEERFIKDGFFPDLIILDVLLSGTNGKTICRDLKSDKKTKHIPILMISAHPDLSQSLDSIHASSFLAKPFELKDLLTKIDENLSY